MPRVDASLILDPARQSNLLFGGRNPVGTALSDTWTWSNGQWSYLSLAVTPSPRSGHRMVFDPVANVGLLFGGEDALGSACGDFWQWDGTAWLQLTPAVLPPARSQPGFAYDERRQRAVLVGGIDGATRIDDVWEWDGANWMQITPALANGLPWTPGARSGFGMAYDRRSEHVVLYGGDAVGCQQDVWSWDGMQWFLHIANTNQPSGRTGAALWLDPSTNQLLLFGGGCGTVYTNEMWELNLPAFARSSSYGSPCLGSNGSLALSVVGTSRPMIGQTFQMLMSGVPLFSPCVGYIGFSNTQFSGVPLPLPLDFVRMYGCFAYMSADLSFPLPAPNNSNNTTQWNLPIPLDPAFLARHIYLQGLALEFGGVRLATVTNGVEARIGDR